MGDFGTGLREHLEHSRTRGTNEPPPAAATFGPSAEQRLHALAEELAARERAVAARELAAAEQELGLAERELAVAEREAELAHSEQRLAGSVARALIEAARDAAAPESVDELAAARARRRGVW